MFKKQYDQWRNPKNYLEIRPASLTITTYVGIVMAVLDVEITSHLSSPITLIRMAGQVNGVSRSKNLLVRFESRDTDVITLKENVRNPVHLDCLFPALIPADTKAADTFVEGKLRVYTNKGCWTFGISGSVRVDTY